MGIFAAPLIPTRLHPTKSGVADLPFARGGKRRRVTAGKFLERLIAIFAIGGGIRHLILTPVARPFPSVNVAAETGDQGSKRANARTAVGVAS